MAIWVIQNTVNPAIFYAGPVKGWITTQSLAIHYATSADALAVIVKYHMQAEPVLSAAPQTVVITSSGNFAVPAGVSNLISVEAWGAGGGACSGLAATYGGSGGGGGAYAKVNNFAVTPSTNLSVTVGTGGAGIAHGDASNGVSGGDSGVGDLSQLLAKGGSGGTGAGGAGGTGGSSGACIGSVKLSGGDGAQAGLGGGGGASASEFGDGVSGCVTSGGTAFGAGGAGGDGKDSGDGDDGTAPGGGGGGAGADSLGAGGSGADGMVRIVYLSPI